MKKLALLFAAPRAASLCQQASAETKQNPANDRRRPFAALLAAIVVAAGLLSFTPLARAQAYFWSNFAGKPGGAGNNDGTGAAATFGSPRSVAVDGNGNVYVADAENNAIRKVTSAGVVTTFAGSMTNPAGSADGTGTAARFSGPDGVAIDANGNLYLADTNNSTIRKITPAGVVTTLAGSAGMSGSTDGTGSAARFSFPGGVTVDANGNLYVADTSNSTIRKVTSAGVVTTLAGSAGLTGSTDGTGSAARFAYPQGVAVDSNGNVYVSDTNNSTIRKITSAGVVTTVAGSAGINGSADGTGSAAQFFFPFQLALDGTGNLYVADSANNNLRKVTTAGVVTTLAGSAGSAGLVDGNGSAARFTGPEGTAVDTNGNVYVGDTGNTAIRKVTQGGVTAAVVPAATSGATVTTLAGSAANAGSTDGTGTAARFSGPNSVAVDANGNIYVADIFNCTIRKITPAGVVTTLAGSAGMSGSTDGTGSAARFAFPNAITVDANSNLYVADTSNSTIRKVTSAGVVTTLAGSPGMTGSTDGTGSAARFANPRGIAVDSNGNVYVGDTDNDTIRKITSTGVVTTLAGSAGASGSADGTGSAARFLLPYQMAADGNGNLYVADSGNSTVRKVTTAAGVVTTLAGSAGSVGFVDGTGSAARFADLQGVAVDTSGNVYVGDSYNKAIRKVTPAGVVTTIGGNPANYGAGNGIGGAAVFSFPASIAVSPSGLLFVADRTEDRIVRGTTQYDHDFNGDGYPDYVLFNASNLETAVWYLKGSSFVSSASGPTLPAGWSVVGTADFNGDGIPDLLLFHASDLKTYIYYMNGSTAIGSAPGPTLPAGWSIAGVGDFNGDGHPDLFLFHASDLKTYVWYMNGPSVTTSAPGPTLPTGWSITGLADFNGDGKPDLLLFNASTLKTYVWYLNGLSVITSAPGPTAPSGWTVAGAVDFNGDGQPDLLFFHPGSLQTYIWYLKGLTVTTSAPGPTLPAGWSLAAP